MTFGLIRVEHIKNNTLDINTPLSPSQKVNVYTFLNSKQ